jgi:hypothetical protein
MRAMFPSLPRTSFPVSLLVSHIALSTALLSLSLSLNHSSFDYSSSLSLPLSLSASLSLSLPLSLSLCLSLSLSGSTAGGQRHDGSLSYSFFGYFGYNCNNRLFGYASVPPDISDGYSSCTGSGISQGQGYQVREREIG